MVIWKYTSSGRSVFFSRYKIFPNYVIMNFVSQQTRDTFSICRSCLGGIVFLFGGKDEEK
jgi:hypothetical protein